MAQGPDDVEKAIKRMRKEKDSVSKRIIFIFDKLAADKNFSKNGIMVMFDIARQLQANEGKRVIPDTKIVIEALKLYAPIGREVIQQERTVKASALSEEATVHVGEAVAAAAQALAIVQDVLMARDEAVAALNTATAAQIRIPQNTRTRMSQSSETTATREAVVQAADFAEAAARRAEATISRVENAVLDARQAERKISISITEARTLANNEVKKAEEQLRAARKYAIEAREAASSAIATADYEMEQEALEKGFASREPVSTRTQAILSGRAGPAAPISQFASVKPGGLGASGVFLPGTTNEVPIPKALATMNSVREEKHRKEADPKAISRRQYEERKADERRETLRLAARNATSQRESAAKRREFLEVLEAQRREAARLAEAKGRFWTNAEARVAEYQANTEGRRAVRNFGFIQAAAANEQARAAAAAAPNQMIPYEPPRTFWNRVRNYSRKAKNTATSLPRTLRNTASSVGSTIASVPGAVGRGLYSGASTIGSTVAAVPGAVGRGLYSGASTVGSTIAAVPGAVAAVPGAIGRGVSGLYSYLRPGAAAAPAEPITEPNFPQAPAVNMGAATGLTTNNNVVNAQTKKTQGGKRRRRRYTRRYTRRY